MMYQLEGFLILAQDHRHLSAVRGQVPFDDDLSVDDRTGSDFHGANTTPSQASRLGDAERRFNRRGPRKQNIALSSHRVRLKT